MKKLMNFFGKVKEIIIFRFQRSPLRIIVKSPGVFFFVDYFSPSVELTVSAAII